MLKRLLPYFNLFVSTILFAYGVISFIFFTNDSAFIVNATILSINIMFTLFLIASIRLAGKGKTILLLKTLRNSKLLKNWPLIAWFFYSIFFLTVINWAISIVFSFTNINKDGYSTRAEASNIMMIGALEIIVVLECYFNAWTTVDKTILNK